ncbi:MAG: phosphatase PAP2 family protein [Alphaproteobacteria bacterium]
MNIDRYIAEYTEHLDVAIKQPFEMITLLGKGAWWVLGTAFLGVFCYLISRYAPHRSAAHRALWLSRAKKFLFSFICIASSGLLVNGLKMLAGRARPRLWFREQIEGFFWLKTGSDYASFPSGHANSAAVMASLAVIFFPRAGWLAVPFFALIAISRIVINAHYSSDVLAGTVIGILSTTALYRWKKIDLLLDKV